MSKPWVGFVAVAFLFLAAVLEWIAGNPILAVFLAVMSIVSFILRIYIIKKLGEHGKDDTK